MNYDQFIEDAITQGSENGVTSLNHIQRTIFLVSEAEVMCDMNGIETFLDHYEPEWIAETAMAFERVGAKEIASEFRRLMSHLQDRDTILDRLNSLITRRVGYGYDSIVVAINRDQRGD